MSGVATQIYALVGELVLSEGTHYTYYATYEAAGSGGCSSVARGAGGGARRGNGARHYRGAGCPPSGDIRRRT